MATAHYFELKLMLKNPTVTRSIGQADVVGQLTDRTACDGGSSRDFLPWRTNDSLVIPTMETNAKR